MMRRQKRRWRKVSVKVVFSLQCSQFCHLSIQKAHKGCGLGRGEDLAAALLHGTCNSTRSRPRSKVVVDNA